MTDGRGIWSLIVLIYPLPFATMSALPPTISTTARRVVQILIGSKFAFNTRTGSCMATPKFGRL